MGAGRGADKRDDKQRVCQRSDLPHAPAFPPTHPPASACKQGREIVCWVGLAGGENGLGRHLGGIAKSGIL